MTQIGDDSLNDAAEDSLASSSSGDALSAVAAVSHADEQEALSLKYSAIWQMINAQIEEKAQTGRLVIAWVTCSRTVMNLMQLQHALAAAKPVLGRLHDLRLPSQDDIESSCLGSVKMDDAGIVDFTEPTAKHFFSQHIEHFFPEAQQELCEACIRYIGLEDVGDCQSFEAIESSYADLPLLKYAAVNWAAHAEAAGRASQYELHDTLAASPPVIQRIGRLAISVPIKRHGFRESLPSSITTFHLASYFGLLGLLEHSIKSSLDRTVDSNGWSLLFWALLGNNHVTAKALIETNSIFVIEEIGNLLFWALGERSSSTTFPHIQLRGQEKLFIGETCTIDIVFAYRHLDLPIRARCSDDLVTLLIDNLEDVNIRGPGGQTPLILAARNGQFGHARRILSRGANRDMADGNEMTAALHGLQPRTKTFHFTDITLRDSCLLQMGGRIIVHASQDLSEDCQSLDSKVENVLIDLLGSRVNIYDQSGRSLLCLAAAAGRNRLVKELLHRGAEELGASKFLPLPMACELLEKCQVTIDNAWAGDDSKLITGVHIGFHGPRHASSALTLCRDAMDRRLQVIDLLLPRYRTAFGASEIREALRGLPVEFDTQTLIERFGVDLTNVKRKPTGARNGWERVVKPVYSNQTVLRNTSRLIIGHKVEATLLEGIGQNDFAITRTVLGCFSTMFRVISSNENATILAGSVTGTTLHGLSCFFSGCEAWGASAQVFRQNPSAEFIHGEKADSGEGLENVHYNDLTPNSSELML